MYVYAFLECPGLIKILLMKRQRMIGPCKFTRNAIEMYSLVIISLIFDYPVILQKPVHLLAFGVATMFLSCLILLSEIHWLRREVYLHQRQQVPSLHGLGRSNLEERFILGVIFFLVISMGSSSMVEEEHYIWHFFILTFFLLLLRKTSTPLVFFKRQNGGTDIWISSVFVLLISGRILRGWHQGGVNWTNLPDISKWLEQSGSGHIKLIQLVSVFLVTCLGLFPLLLVGSKRFLIQVVGFSFLISGFLVFLHVLKNQYDMFASSYYDSNLSVQIVYASLGLATFGTFVVFPWLIPSSSSRDFPGNVSISVDIQNNFPWVELRNSLYVIGSAYILSWCLLQLVLQQPVNSVPILLLLVQLLAIMLCFSHGRLHLAEWVEVSHLLSLKFQFPHGYVCIFLFTRVYLSLCQDSYMRIEWWCGIF